MIIGLPVLILVIALVVYVVPRDREQGRLSPLRT
jgi:hypothetical protein